MEASIDLKSVIGLIQRQIRLIATTIVVVFAIALAGIYSITPKYQANAILMVDTSTKNLLAADNRFNNSGNENARVESEVGILKSDQILRDVVLENNLKADDEFGLKVSLKDKLLTLLRISAPKQLSDDEELSLVLNKFRSAVGINRQGLTYLISVNVTSTDPAKAAMLTNSLTRAYVTDQINSKVTSALAARDTIQRRLPSANAAIIENENKFDIYVNETIARFEKDNPGTTQLATLRATLQQLQGERSKSIDRINIVERYIQAKNYRGLASELDSQNLQQLQANYVSTLAKIQTGGSETQIVSLRNELANIENQINAGAKEQLNEVRSNLAASQERENAVRNDIQQAFLSSNLPSDVLTKLSSLRQSSEIARAQYQTLLSKLQDLDAQTELQLPDSRVVSAALTPTSNSYPNRNLILAISLIGALALGVGLAVTREYFIGGFTSHEQVQSVLRTTIAAVAPKQSTSDTAKAGGRIPDLLVTSPLSLFSEAVRRLRLALDREIRKKEWSSGVEEDDKSKIILVSSSLPNEGKSTIALSLARAYALTGQRTLLIDCDLRKPSLNKYLGLEPSHDFLDYLRQGASVIGLPAMTMNDPMSDLTVLVGGRRSDVPTDELVMSERMSRVLAGARKHFDYIILDTPPVEPVVDALYLARHADAIVFVLQWANTPQSSAKRALAALQESKRPETNVVTILNQQERTKIAGYSSYSNYYDE
jgi:capsular exopolysaccharide synthesis family protein